MSERLTNGYKILFEVRLLHHYWLDEGATVFDKIEDHKKDLRLMKYDMRTFLSVRPTATSKKTLEENQCLFRETAKGLIVAAPVNAQMPVDAVLEFIVTVKNSQFYDYTALTLRRQSIYELYNELYKSTYRYKENVPVLSNRTGTIRNLGTTNELFLSQNYPVLAANDHVESLILSGNALEQLTSDSDGTNTTKQELFAQADESPIFIHQGDSPAITSPTGLTGVPKRGVQLTGDVEDDVFVYLSLSARTNNSDLDFVDSKRNIKEPHPIYQVRFKNRSTFWNYISLKTGDVILEREPLPLTYFGNAGTKRKPSDGLVKAKKSGSSSKISRLVSEIYV